MTATPLVSVIVPARDEAQDIDRCLAHITAQDHPHDRLEVIVVDGCSKDGTPDIARRCLADSGIRWRVIVNTTGTTPSNLNIGLDAATGSVVCRVDARSFIPSHYVRTCKDVLTMRSDVAVVGGAQVARARTGSFIERGIARTLNNRLVMGGARYRSAASSGPDDTVYLGAFRTEQLRLVGGWDEGLTTNQDFDLNQRMQRFGLIWFDDSIPVLYRPRSELRSLAAQYHRFGMAKSIYWRSRSQRPLPRQRLLVLGGVGVPSLTIATIMRSRRRLRSAALATLLGAAGALAVDEAGTEASAPMSERCGAALAMAAVAGGWTAGVLTGMLMGERSEASREDRNQPLET